MQLILTSEYRPITTTSPASDYVGIDQTVLYGDTVILSQTAGIVDTGTTLVLLASGMLHTVDCSCILNVRSSDAIAAYQNATGATTDEDTGLLTITAEQFANLQSLFFNIGGVRILNF